MTQREYMRITAMIAVLRDIIADGYRHRTIENVLANLESRKREAEKNTTI